ncbi:MAG TPA: hypothetical protein PKD10_14455 [Paracoccaceae bacterium]|nr:hypothetical protein [Paracoccaceae bacterium]HMO71852.1 hypothetical protein [Paracoccaceae bacterium]
MTRILIACALGLAGLTLSAPPAAASPQCGPRAAVLAHLAEKYRETRQSVGLAANSMVMEVFASRDSGSWTITVTSPQGVTCLVASGQGFEAVTEDLPAKGAPA